MNSEEGFHIRKQMSAKKGSSCTVQYMQLAREQTLYSDPKKGYITMASCTIANIAMATCTYMYVNVWTCM